MNMLIKKPRALIFVIILGIMTGLLMRYCHRRNVVINPIVKYSVRAQHLHQSLFFTGVIQPLNETALTCPIDAVVETMHYHYGQFVKQDNIVLTLNSTELEKQYNDALTDYLKSKDNFNVAEARFNGTQELWDTGLISKNNYLSEKSSLNTSRIALLQSTQKLTEMLQKVGDPTHQDLAALNIADFDKVQQALNSRHNLILLKAPVNGVLLYPHKMADDKTSKIAVGSAVKADQVIAIIGDMSGIHIEIDIPETDINKIHKGMKAQITGAALGKQQLLGRVTSINTQAIPTNNGASPFFSAIVEVTNLTPTQREAIKIGMSAAIELLVDEDKQLLIPIKAIKQDNGKRIVTILNQNGAKEEREVITGIATADQVVIDRGLKEGEVVVYDV
jgi:HlyD family secretion protein